MNAISNLSLNSDAASGTILSSAFHIALTAAGDALPAKARFAPTPVWFKCHAFTLAHNPYLIASGHF